MRSKEVVITKVNDLKNGGMKAFHVNNVDILLSRIDDTFYAVGAFCTHYGAPLQDGVLSGDRIVCPWHHACFDAKTGNLLEPPAQDAIPSYEVKIDGEDVIVTIPEQTAHERTPEMIAQDSGREKRTFVILGAGAAGNAAAQTLREDGFQGRILMITNENRGPYDRPNLSKDYLQGEAEPEWMPLRSDDFYRDHNIEFVFNKKVILVNTRDKRVVFSNKETLEYNKLLVTTGGIARSLKVPGSDLKNIFTLRSFDDADRIIEASTKSTNAVVIGASFIGMETADSLRHRGLDVTVVAPETTPLEHIFGTDIGNWFKQLHEENGVKFKLDQSVETFEGTEMVKTVVLKNGERINADLVLVGIGVRPATDFIEGLAMATDGGIKVDKYFHAGSDIYAAGDIATFHYWHSSSDARIEHWRTAEQQGRIAAHNMAGNEITFRSIPFFWTAQAGITLRYVGHAKEWDEILLSGNIQKKDFIAYYVKDGLVRAAAGCNRDQEMAAIEELLRLKKMPAPEKLKDSSVDLVSLLKK